MATSGSTDYADSRTQIISDAYAELGALSAGESLTSDETTQANRFLNRMLKAWQAMGFNLWRQTEGTLTLTADTQSYTLSPRALRISSARFVNTSGQELPMTELSRMDYFNLPDKASRGTPTTFYYDKQRTTGVFYIWPVIASPTTETIKYTYERSFEDFDDAADEPDVPQEWYQAVVSGLAARLAPVVFPSRPDVHQSTLLRAKMDLQEAQDFDREDTSIFLELGERWR